MFKKQVEFVILSAVIAVVLNIFLVNQINLSSHTALSTIGPVKLTTEPNPPSGGAQCMAVMMPPKSSTTGNGWPFIYQFKASDCVWTYNGYSSVTYAIDWVTTWLLLFVILCALFILPPRLMLKGNPIRSSKK